MFSASSAADQEIKFPGGSAHFCRLMNVFECAAAAVETFRLLHLLVSVCASEQAKFSERACAFLHAPKNIKYFAKSGMQINGSAVQDEWANAAAACWALDRQVLIKSLRSVGDCVGPWCAAGCFFAQLRHFGTRELGYVRAPD